MDKNIDIVNIVSRPQYPNILYIKHRATSTKGYYVVNTDRITPVNDNNISIQEAIDIMSTKIQEQLSFARLNPHATYHQNGCDGEITPFDGHDSYIRYHLHNTINSPNIIVEIYIHIHGNIHETEYLLTPDTIHDIDTPITNLCNDIIQNIQHNPAIYRNNKNSQHQYIALLHAATHYFSQPNNFLRTSMQQAIKDIQQYYVYQP